MFLANAKSIWGAFFGYFMEFFGFSGKMLVFPLRISSGKIVIAIRNGTVPFRIRKAFGYLRYSNIKI
jgi:hypothetical protein